MTRDWLIAQLHDVVRAHGNPEVRAALHELIREIPREGIALVIVQPEAEVA
jgi:ABC-type arginine transport system ATPase subunit